MSGIGSSEFILLLVIGLIVLGPKRLPEVANRIGGWIGQARRMTRVMKRQLEDELNLDAHRSILPPTPPFARERPKPAKPAESTAEADPELAPQPPPDHIPAEDDTYSPLHDDESAGAPGADKGGDEGDRRDSK
jgi:sec-independent protein translocase protein TatB